MMLWIAMALLAVAACLALLVPLYRTRPEAASASAVSIYRDQLGEVARDVESGLIAEGEAAAARTEIARRLIHAAESPDKGETPSDRRRSLAAGIAIVAVPVIAVALYVGLGSPNLPDAPLSARLSGPTETQDIGVLIGRVEAHLAANPNDGAGWEVIAPVYVRLGRFDEAARAYGNVIRILGSNATREANLGEALVRADDGVVTGEAQAAFRRSLALDPGGVLPRFYLALALGQQGKTAEAAVALRALIAEGPPTAPWVPLVKDVLAGLESGEGAKPQPPQAQGPGPTAADVEAAAGMSAADRTAMIEGMVAQLAARLETDPGDAAGWARLVRSYMVLGRQADASAALAKARTALAGRADKVALVEAEAKAAGVTE